MNAIDSFLNRITMYRLVLYSLIAYVGVATVLGALGMLPYSPFAILLTTGAFIIATSILNALFAWAYGAIPGKNSSLITALILALIVTPVIPSDPAGLVAIGFISLWAIGSKYVLARGHKHFFNPAAFGVAAAAVIAGQSATWWVAGNAWLLPFLVIGGLLIIRKLRRFDLVGAFTVAAFATIAFTSGNPLNSIWTTLIHSSFLFLASIMLTEPATMPGTRGRRLWYGALVGILFAPAVHIGSYYFTPETALLAGNLFAYFISRNGARVLTLISRSVIADNAVEFVFRPDRPLLFSAGQYLEWTVPGQGSDNRGNRRYFTIASAAEERELRLTVKFYKPMSSFKRKLLALRPGDTVSVAQLAGDFTLPKDARKKLAFIAGGIGVTPFRSMVGSMLARGEHRDAVLLYGAGNEEEIAYQPFFDTAVSRTGLRVRYAIASGTPSRPDVFSGFITPELIKREIPDYGERIFYISGPPGMVTSFRRSLRELGLPLTHIHTDYFPGFA